MHHKFFSKAKGPAYVYEKMLKSLPPLQQRVHKSLSIKGEKYFNELYKKQAKQNGLIFDKEAVMAKKQADFKKTINWIFDDENTTTD